MHFPGRCVHAGPASRGNPATVVLDADGQSDAALSAIAREFSHAEVAFVLAAERARITTSGCVSSMRARKRRSSGTRPWRPTPCCSPSGRRALGVCRARRSGIVEIECASRTARNPARDPSSSFGRRCPNWMQPAAVQDHLARRRSTQAAGNSLHEVMPARMARKGSSRLLVPIADARALDAPGAEFRNFDGARQRTRDRKDFSCSR